MIPEKLTNFLLERKLKSGDIVVLGAPFFAEEILSKYKTKLDYDDTYKIEKLKGNTITIKVNDKPIEIDSKYFVVDESIKEAFLSRSEISNYKYPHKIKVSNKEIFISDMTLFPGEYFDQRRFSSGTNRIYHNLAKKHTIYLKPEQIEELKNDKTVNIIESIDKSITEARATIKRKYGIHSAHYVNEKAPLRNSIIRYIGNQIMTEEQIKNMLIRVEEDLGKSVNKERWFKSNMKYFKCNTNENGDITYQLSKFGKKIYDKMSITKTTINTKLVAESLSNFITTNETVKLFEGRSEVQNAIKHIMHGAGWAGDEYLYQFGGSLGLSPSDLSDLAVELAKKGLLFREEDLTGEMADGDEDPRDSDIKPMSVADAKKMKF